MAPIKIIHFTLHDLHIRLTFITLKKQEPFSEINETSRYLLAAVGCYWKYGTVFAGMKPLTLS